jgi:putative serine protease PepD
MIKAVTSGGPAAVANLPNGVVVTKFNDRVIDPDATLVAAVWSRVPGDVVTLTYLDQSGNAQTIHVTLATA